MKTRKARAQNRSLWGINEDSSTKLFSYAAFAQKDYFPQVPLKYPKHQEKVFFLRLKDFQRILRKQALLVTSVLLVAIDGGRTG